MHFEPDESIAVVVGGEAGNSFGAMFVDALGRSDVTPV